MDRVVTRLRDGARLSAAQIVDVIAGEAKSFIGGAQQFDDQTLVVIEKT